MDEFLHQFREPPRPAFAQTLRTRLRETEQNARRQAARARTMRVAGAGVAVAVLSMVVALNLAQFQPKGAWDNQNTEQPVAAPDTALLLPVKEPPRLIEPKTWQPVAVTLRVSQTPVSHHR